MDRNYHIIFFKNNFVLRRPRVANFADIIKLQPCLLPKPFETQKKLKELEIVY